MFGGIMALLTLIWDEGIFLALLDAYLYSMALSSNVGCVVNCLLSSFPQLSACCCTIELDVDVFSLVGLFVSLLMTRPRLSVFCLKLRLSRCISSNDKLVYSIWEFSNVRVGRICLYERIMLVVSLPGYFGRNIRTYVFYATSWDIFCRKVSSIVCWLFCSKLCEMACC